MTGIEIIVIPAKAGIQPLKPQIVINWIPDRSRE